jgi:hypothetical protein
LPQQVRRGGERRLARCKDPAVPARLVAAALLVVGLCSAGLAHAHVSDPRTRTVVDAVTPPLPTGVLVQAAAGIAEQLVVANPTAHVLSVLDERGRPFLQISASGVHGDVATLAFWTTANPSGTSAGAPPPVAAARGRGAPRWVTVSTGSSWGWFDHRLHPARVVVPTGSGAGRLYDWEVPLTYGLQLVTVRGHVELRSLRGAFEVRADPAPSGLSVQLLQGRLPGLFVMATEGTTVSVPGRDGEVFLEIAGTARVNVHSRTFVEDQWAQGKAAGPPSAVVDLQPARGSNGAAYSWLDARLQYPQTDPPAGAVRSRRPTVVKRWSIPVTVNGTAGVLTGVVRWVPSGQARAASGGSPPVALVTGLLVLVAAALAGVARRHRSATSQG